MNIHWKCHKCRWGSKVERHDPETGYPNSLFFCHLMKVLHERYIAECESYEDKSRGTITG